MKQINMISGVLLILLFGVGCGSSDIGDILGGSGGGGSAATADVRGTVERVDTRDRAIVVRTDASTQIGLRGGDQTVVLYYDDRTVVEFEGRTYQPSDLEPGDRIAVVVDQSGGRAFAREVRVLYDVSGGVGSGGPHATDVRGTVREVDAARRTLRIEDTARGRDVTVEYDTSTIVEFETRRYRPEDLERGDRVEVQVREVGSRLLAERIDVVRDARGTAGRRELEGTVRYVDTRNRTIELERTRWGLGFRPDAGDLVVVHYDADTVVRFQGRSYGPENLERGDVISVEVDEVAGRFMAESIEVLRDARASF